uniref:glycoside hydrolase family 10 protein n=1 Tax=Actinacidiphila soli TaxID=2487275 RepID=UPI001F0BBC30|nr:family 10 glycosylhydrolase [Actinacidiphila soli]
MTDDQGARMGMDTVGRHITRRAFAGGAAGAALALSVAGEAFAAPRSQLRGMWIATVANRDWPSSRGLSVSRQRRELLDLLDCAADRRLNAVMFQVRPTADSFWPSSYEPWSAYLTGTQGRDPGWDPLGTAVREAHRRGLQLHAWFNPYRIANNTDRSRLVPRHPARVHPDWVVPYGGKLYYNPGLPEVRRFVQDAMLDAVRRYPIDAVHWDDYFYPYPVAGKSFGDDYAYDRYGSEYRNRAAWRRHNIDLLVHEMASRIRLIRPGTRFGISPFAVWRNRGTDRLGSNTRGGVQTYDDLYADTRGWVRKEWIDYIVPQVYWHLGNSVADYAELIPWWSDTVAGTRVRLYIGEALYKAGAARQPRAWRDPTELSRHLSFDADYPQVRGNVFFAAKDVANDPMGAMNRVVADHYGTRVQPPK